MIPLLLLFADITISIPELYALVAIVAFVLTGTVSGLTMYFGGKYTTRDDHKKLEDKVDANEIRLVQVEDTAKRVETIEERQRNVIKEAAARDEVIKAVLAAVTDNNKRLSDIERELRDVSETIKLSQQPVVTLNETMIEVKKLLAEHLEKEQIWHDDHETRLVRLETIETTSHKRNKKSAL